MSSNSWIESAKCFFGRQPLEAPESPRQAFRVDGIPVNRQNELVHDLRSMAEQDPVLREAFANLIVRSLMSKGDGFVCAFATVNKGITTPYEDVDGVDVNIIAVPGIGDNALGSWTSPDGRVWLFGFLPEDKRNVRVLLYGHSTTRRGDSMDESIDKLGDNLLERIYIWSSDYPHQALPRWLGAQEGTYHSS
ncbi:ankyrin repeat-containing protein [Penicillium argentinense]|uniref:Ankyrin repeat-containing protein n=1 Tax=Penicillium argentinense TaxID=1131581 RepID=A0A9W9EHV3_9EURO|nr:ankyrin repeat-containing protein [Penicillium argentinense]KAJ5082059.1 ankyrin repeat-containing protein [Penicillium argentinense]